MICRQFIDREMGFSERKRGRGTRARNEQRKGKDAVLCDLGRVCRGGKDTDWGERQGRMDNGGLEWGMKLRLEAGGPVEPGSDLVQGGVR